MSYTKDCDNCNEKILMQQVNGKWGAYDPSGTSWHKCKQNKNGKFESNSNNGGQQKNEQKAKAWVRGIMEVHDIGADKVRTTVAAQREVSLEERVEEMDKRLMRVQKIIDASNIIHAINFQRYAKSNYAVVNVTHFYQLLSYYSV